MPVFVVVDVVFFCPGHPSGRDCDTEEKRRGKEKERRTGEYIISGFRQDSRS